MNLIQFILKGAEANRVMTIFIQNNIGMNFTIDDCNFDFKRENITEI